MEICFSQVTESSGHAVCIAFAAPQPRERGTYIGMPKFAAALSRSPARFPFRCSSVRSRVFARTLFCRRRRLRLHRQRFLPQSRRRLMHGGGGEGIGASGSSHYRMTKGWEDDEEKEDVEERRGILISFSDRPRH